MRIIFLGTGAADWAGVDQRGEYRRYTSTMLDGRLLIDVTSTVLDQIEDPSAITDVFFTHSHGDHFDPDALRALAPCRAYAHEGWAGKIQVEGVQVIPLRVGEAVEAAGFTVTPMPSNHAPGETTLHYLVEKDEKRLLYATDGAWLRNEAHHIIGEKPLDAAVFDATIGDGFEGDYRVFEHNSIDMIRLMLKTMHKTGRLAPDAPVYLTHLARTLHPDQATLERNTEKPMVVCRDGLRVEL